MSDSTPPPSDSPSGGSPSANGPPGAPSGSGLHVVLTAHRSLGPKGFLLLMTVFGLVCFVTGLVFLTAGAWPVMGFFGLDVALLWLAFRLNYRAGRIHELVDLTPELLRITRVHPSGRREAFDFNPYWVRVAFSEWPDGRTDLRLASHGREFPFGRFLNDDERREFADMLRGALSATRQHPLAGA